MAGTAAGEAATQRGVCGKQWVFEADGSVYPGDFYVWISGGTRQSPKTALRRWMKTGRAWLYPVVHEAAGRLPEMPLVRPVPQWLPEKPGAGDG